MLPITLYVVGIAVTVLFSAAIAYSLLQLREKVRSYTELEARLPDACRLPGLKQLVAQTESELGGLQKNLATAQVLISQREQAEQWMTANADKYEEMRRQVPALNAEFQKIRTEVEGFRQEREEVEALCRETRHQREWLVHEDRRLSESVDRQTHELENLKSQVEGLQSRQAGLQANLEELQAHLSGRELELRGIQADLLPAKEELAQARLELDTVRAECQEARNQREWAIRENQRLLESVDRQTHELENLKSQLGGLQSRQSGLQAQLEELQAHISGREQELSGIRAELLPAKQELAEARREHDEVSAETNSKRAEIQQLRAEHQTVTRLLDAAEKRWTQLAPASGGSDDERLAELWKPVLDKNAFSQKSEVNEPSSLSATQEYLANLGLKFHDRVIRAFHTSLKTSEMSPLVVLAGISGTGKSELPRRYAEGMGMYFLNLAVQPRWDSPQDMFGFYNYLENRYRATELGRALVQMDRYFREDGRGWSYPKEWEEHNLSGRMLLVLLDEMNLARVEYYFSEFLSRLEIRRGLNRDNRLERRQAEISLEVGLRALARGNGDVKVKVQPTLQMFVDTNVMFVGTMNEDETTQTLSDKVIDRSNLLRFGKPSQLIPKSVTAAARTGTNWMADETWKSWVKTEQSLPPQIRQEVAGWVGELNSAMQLIGRPFAHRTFLSVLSYVANYPDLGAYRLAVADQIELKLLPRFRGMDLQESSTRQSLGKVQALLGMLGDDQLAGAINDCTRMSEHQFLWQGIDRTATS